MPLTLTLSRKALNNVDDVAGRWQFEGGSVDENKKHIAKLRQHQTGHVSGD
jgi:hypothetical protein